MKEEKKKAVDDLNKKGLEEAIKEKVSPLLEETMEKNWGITIPKIETDITDKLRNPQMQIYFAPDLTFSSAKKVFKSEFLKKGLLQHLGNVSQLAKTLGIDRRSVHRAIKSLDIDVEELRMKDITGEKYQQEIVDRTLRSTFDKYKEIIQPQKMEKMYSDIPALSRNIAKVLPSSELTWKQAEKEFEKQFLALALKEQENDVSGTAKKLRIRVETLYRKMKKLGI